jgi:hypothetical protein
MSTANAYRVAERRNLQRAAVAEQHGHAVSAHGFRIAANVDAAAARQHTAAAAAIMRDETAAALTRCNMCRALYDHSTGMGHAPGCAMSTPRDPWTRGCANWRDGRAPRVA